MTKNFFIASLVLLSSTLPCLAQEAAIPEVTNVTKLLFLNPGISHEARIGKQQTLYGELYASMTASFGYSEALGFSSELYFDPAFTVQYRHYYNGAQRQQKGKRTDMNSMNYLGAVTSVVFSKRIISDEYSTGYTITNKRRPVTTLAVVWGMQRNYQRHFSLDLTIGPGFYFSNEWVIINGGKKTNFVSGVTGFAQLRLGFWLNKQNKN